MLLSRNTGITEQDETSNTLPTHVVHQTFVKLPTSFHQRSVRSVVAVPMLLVDETSPGAYFHLPDLELPLDKRCLDGNAEPARRILKHLGLEVLLELREHRHAEARVAGEYKFYNGQAQNLMTRVLRKIDTKAGI